MLVAVFFACVVALIRPVAPVRRTARRATDPIGEWVSAQSFEPGTRIVVNDVEDGISFSCIFWRVAEDLLSGGKAVLVCPNARPDRFPLDAYSRFVDSLNLDNLKVRCIEDAPFPALAVDVDAREVVTIDPSGMVPALQNWVQDVIVDSKVCPFTQSPSMAGTGLANVEPGPVGYPTCGASGSSDAALVALMASFWDASIDLLNSEERDLSTLLLAAPYFAVKDHDAFVRMCSAIVANLKLVKADELLALVFFHPEYERARIEPHDKLVHGHLPPNAWLPAYLRLQHDEDTVASLTDAQLANADYQRRAPFTVINVLRAPQVAAAESVVPWEIIEPEPGRRVRVSGARVYAANTWRLATQSKSKSDDATGHDYLVV